jgi:hypothetical protein
MGDGRWEMGVGSWENGESYINSATPKIFTCLDRSTHDIIRRANLQSNCKIKQL